jgi:hypothetical protein
LFLIAAAEAAFRLGAIEVNRDRDAFLIAETRLTATCQFGRGNNDDATEPGVASRAVRGRCSAGEAGGGLDLDPDRRTLSAVCSSGRGCVTVAPCCATSPSSPQAPMRVKSCGRRRLLARCDGNDVRHRSRHGTGA